MVSVTGCTITVTVAGVLLVRLLAALVAVTEKVNTCAAVSSGTAGAVKVWIEPSAAAGVNVIGAPPVWVQLKVSAPLAGSTAEAVRVTPAALLGTVMVVPLTAGGPANEAVALTAGGVFGGAITIGTVTLAGAENGTRLPSPTISWNVRFCGPATTGAANVAFAAVGLLIVTIGSPGLTICVHWNGPVGGVLAVPSSVTVTPANGGFGLELKVGNATVVSWPETQVSGGSVA